MARTLHTCNTLRKQKYLENGTLSRPSKSCSASEFTFRESIVTQRNHHLHSQPSGAKNGILSFFFLHGDGITRFHDGPLFYFWYQYVPLSPMMCKRCIDYAVLAQASSKTTKTKSPYTLYRRPLAAGQHHTVPPGNRGQLNYNSLHEGVQFS